MDKDKSFSRSRSVRYTSSTRTRARHRNVCLEKRVDDGKDERFPTTMIASEGGRISSAGIITDLKNSGSEDEVDKLRCDLQTALDESQRAAEYGLVLLEEKQLLQQEVDKLELQYEERRHDINILNQHLQDSRSESTFLKQQLASLKADFIEECDEREEALVRNSDDLSHQLANARRSLKAEAEQRRGLEDEVERLRKREQELEEKLTVGRRQGDGSQEKQILKQASVELRERMRLSEQEALNEENERLRQENSELVEEISALYDELDALDGSIIDRSGSDSQIRKDDNSDTPQSTPGPSSARASPLLQESSSGSPGFGRQRSQTLPRNAERHYPSTQASASPDLTECTGTDDSHTEPDATVGGLAEKRTRHRLPVKCPAPSTNAFEERERELMQQASALRAELVAALTELDGLRETSAEAEVAASNQVIRLEKELELVQQREQEIRSRVQNQEEMFYTRQKEAGESEDVLSHLSGELRTLHTETIKVGRLAASLGNLKSKKTMSARASVTEADYLHMHSNVELLNTIRQNVRSVKSALDSVLMESLQKTAAKIGQPGAGEDSNMSDERKAGLLEDIQRLQEQLTTKSHETVQLHSLLKMARITAHANLERTQSTHQQQEQTTGIKVNTLERLVEKLRQDCKDYVVERRTYQTRCDELIVELAEQKKDVSSLRDESSLLEAMLKKTIAQKLAMTEKVENLEFEMQRKSLSTTILPSGSKLSVPASKCPASPSAKQDSSAAKARPTLLSNRLRFIQRYKNTNK